jgi:DNA mismatch repair protein MutL
MPPDQVDVNVHPTKAEVRFRDSSFLYSMVLSTIRNRLSAENLTAQLHVTSTLQTPVAHNAMSAAPFAPTGPLPPPPVFAEPPRPQAMHAEPVQQPYAPAAPAPTEAGPPSAEALRSAFEGPATNGAAPPAPALDTAGEDLRAIQLYNAYLVVETPEGMLVIDQHALHERILFEQLKRRIRAGALETQRLLIPEPIELSAEQAALALEHQAALTELGLAVEDFGGGTLLLHSYPAILGNRSPERILKAVVDHLGSKDRLPTREQLLNDLLSLMACHSAVRAGDPLTQEQIATLLAQRALANDVHHCPHGRPTALLFSRQDLDRQFGRT